MNKQLSSSQQASILAVLKTRFEKNMNRHPGIDWKSVQSRLEQSPEKLWSLHKMEETGGEPDVTGFENDLYLFCDCSAESPKGRRSICYDPEALESRKEHKPKHSAIGMAQEMGVEILDEAHYRTLQQLVKLDAKSSSWLKTPEGIRKAGGAIFGDWRYGHVFVYHNGAESYYAARGFRGILKV